MNYYDNKDRRETIRDDFILDEEFNEYDYAVQNYGTRKIDTIKKKFGESSQNIKNRLNDSDIAEKLYFQIRHYVKSVNVKRTIDEIKKRISEIDLDVFKPDIPTEKIKILNNEYLRVYYSNNIRFIKDLPPIDDYFQEYDPEIYNRIIKVREIENDLNKYMKGSKSYRYGQIRSYIDSFYDSAYNNAKNQIYRDLYEQEGIKYAPIFGSDKYDLPKFPYNKLYSIIAELPNKSDKLKKDFLEDMVSKLDSVIERTVEELKFVYCNIKNNYSIAYDIKEVRDYERLLNAAKNYDRNNKIIIFMECILQRFGVFLSRINNSLVDDFKIPVDHIVILINSIIEGLTKAKDSESEIKFEFHAITDFEKKNLKRDFIEELKVPKSNFNILYIQELVRTFIEAVNNFEMYRNRKLKYDDTYNMITFSDKTGEDNGTFNDDLKAAIVYACTFNSSSIFEKTKYSDCLLPSGFFINEKTIKNLIFICDRFIKIDFIRKTIIENIKSGLKREFDEKHPAEFKDSVNDTDRAIVNFIIFNRGDLSNIDKLRSFDIRDKTFNFGKIDDMKNYCYHIESYSIYIKIFEKAINEKYYAEIIEFLRKCIVLDCCSLRFVSMYHLRDCSAEKREERKKEIENLLRKYISHEEVIAFVLYQNQNR